MNNRKHYKLYYAHSKLEYGSVGEAEIIKKIRKHFRAARILNPAKYQNFPKGLANVMDYYLMLVDQCAMVVFKKCEGHIGAGVGAEINFALENGIPVYEIFDDSDMIVKLQRRVNYLSVEETRAIQKIIRERNRRYEQKN